MAQLLVKTRKAAIIPYLRWWICGLLFASTAINYIYRQTFNVLAPYVKVEFHWTNSDFALILIGFRIAYALGETVSGKFLDWLGTRLGLLIAVTVYSISAMLTGLATGLRSFAVFRFLVGAGESANWPGATKTVSEWFPKAERGWAVAIFDERLGRRRSHRACTCIVALPSFWNLAAGILQHRIPGFPVGVRLVVSLSPARGPPPASGRQSARCSSRQRSRKRFRNLARWWRVPGRTEPAGCNC